MPRPRNALNLGLGTALGAVLLGLGLAVGAQAPRPSTATVPATFAFQAVGASPATSSPKDALERAATINNLGVARLEQYSYPAAVEEFQRATALAPDFVPARVNLAIAYFYRNRYAEAEQEARAALARMPDSPHANYVLGLVARIANEPDTAADAFRRVLAFDPHDAGARIGLAQVLLKQRQFGDAAEQLAAAAAAEPFNMTAVYNLAVALTREGRAQEGRAEMARFEALRASGQGLGYTSNYLEQGRYAEAVVSTGLEPGLVSLETPSVRFRPARLETGPPVPVSGHEAAHPSGERAGGTSAAPTLGDLDRDGDLDLIVTGPPAAVLRNDGGKFAPWDAGIDRDALRRASGVVVADYDNDAVPDVLVAGPDGVALFRQGASGVFENQTAGSGLGAMKTPAETAALADVDHDGDLDLVVGGTAGLTLARNNGNGTFSDVTADAAPALTSPVRAIVPTDLDNRRDLDLLVVTADEGVRFLRNRRDGTFTDQSERTGLGGPALAAAAADVNKDDLPDIVVAGATIDVSTSRGAGPLRRQTVSPLAGVTALQALDYDNDGLLDIVALSPAGLRVLRCVGDRWQDVTDAAVPKGTWPAATGSGGSPSRIASGDIDADGDTDLVIGHAGGSVTLLTNEGGSAHRAVALRLTGRVSNRSGIGAKIDLRAGSLRQRLETTTATPSPIPADVTFGLGGRAAADVVRVIWPSGVVQAELLDGAPATGRAPASLVELDRKPSSCPFLFTWNGERFEFVTDFLGGGELGYWVAPGVRNTPDPDEYVRIPRGALASRDGRYELRVTNELEEAIYLDRLQLVSVTHPPGTEVFPNEGMRGGPQAPFTLYVTSGARPVARATGAGGQDVTDRLARIDRRYVDDLPLLPLRGYAEPHALTLDLASPGGDPDAGRLLLLLTGWTDYAFSSDNVAAAQAGLALQPPSLQVRDTAGAWRTVIEQVGVPVGRPQTVVVDLTGRFLSASREVRIVTSMRVYWDEARVAAGATITPDPGRVVVEAGVPTGRVVVRRSDPIRADLAWRGFSAEGGAAGGGGRTDVAPPTYDYARVSLVSPWKQMPGRYTREGDVRELVATVDDRFVVSRPGDVIAVSFPAAAGATQFLFAHGFTKEMDINSASPDQVAPLPYRGMPHYPYSAAAAKTLLGPARYGDHHELYNTRVVGRMLPSF